MNILKILMGLMIISQLAVGQDSAIVYNPKRAIRMQGSSNFRDLGGYPAANGKYVKWNKIFRSADISQLTNQDFDQFKKLNLETVCDLRGPHETQSKPDKYPEGTRYINLPAGSENVGTPATYAQMNQDSMMYQFYTKTEHLKAKYKPMFDELLSLPAEKSLLFHCTAGKDRTGIGAALILLALGVDRSYVIADYKATNYYWENSKMIEMMIKSGVPEARVRAMMAADPNYIKAFFTTIESRYGSVELFLKNELELDDKKLKVLKENYLGG